MRGSKRGVIGLGRNCWIRRDNDVPRSYWSVVFRFIAWQTKRWFFPLPYRKYVRDEKKEKRKERKKRSFSPTIKVEKVAILQIKFVFLLYEVWKFYRGSWFYRISIKLLRNRDKNNCCLLGNQTESGKKVDNFIVPRVNVGFYNEYKILWKN